MPQVMAMKDGFETGAVSADWDSQTGSPAVSTAAARDGKHGLVASSSLIQLLRKQVSSMDHARAGFWFHPNSSVADGDILLRIDDSTAGTNGFIVFADDNVGTCEVYARLSLLGVGSVDTGRYTASGWTHIAVHARVGHSGATWLELYINHELQETVSLDGGDELTWEDIVFGNSTFSGSGTCYLDTFTLRSFSSNGTDVFIIHPDGLDDVVCTLQEDMDNPFHVITGKINTHDAERAKVTYAEGETGGSARRVTHGLAGFDFQAQVLGGTAEEAGANAGILRRALTNPGGGTIEYKPRGRDSHVMNTFYRYLPSPSPELVGKSNRTTEYMQRVTKARSSDSVFENTYQCKVKTLARATSDPDDVLEILIEEIVGSYASAAPDNLVVVPPTAVMGDAIVPIVKVRVDPSYASPQSSVGSLLVYKRDAISDENHGLEWMEAELSQSTYRATWSSSTHAGGSGSTGGYLYRTDLGYLLFDMHTGMDMSYAGKVTPIVLGGSNGGTWTFRLRWRRWASGGLIDQSIAEIGESDVRGSIHDANYFEEVDFPPFPVRAADQADPSFDLADYLGDMWVELRASISSGPGEVRVDALMMFKADDWISILAAPMNLDGNPTSQNTLLGTASNSNRLEIDAIERVPFLFDEGNDFAVTAWDAEGSPVPDLELRRGTHSVLGFVPMSNRASADEMPLGYDSRVELMVAVNGIYSTLTPFEEP